MSTEDTATGSFLNTPLSISDLVKGGTQFEINTNFDDNLPDELFDDLHIAGSDDEDDREVLISPWEKTFDELRKQMTKINDDIYKRITQEGNPDAGTIPNRARVVIQYNAYWEKEPAPFDSSYMRGQAHVFHCGKQEVLEGLETAVKTMHKGEEAQFLISYRLLFREMGCPPRIKPKADGLFIIKLIDFADIGDENAIDSVSEENKNKFSVVYEKIKDVHLKGLDYFKNGNLCSAAKSFHKAVTALEFCRLSNEEEQIEQQKFLVKLYTNLAVCYNKLNQPQKACCMCNEIKRLTDINKNCKVLFQQGRALFMIGEFVAARSKLVKAQNLEPNNQEISNELKLLNQKYEEYRQSERQVWQKAMGLVRDTKSSKSQPEHIDTFKDEIRKFLKDFKDKIGPQQLSLPDGLSPEEVSCVDELAKELQLKLTITERGTQKTYVIAKPAKTPGE